MVRSFEESGSSLPTRERRTVARPADMASIPPNDKDPGVRALEILRKHSEDSINAQVSTARAMAGPETELMLESRVCPECLTTVLDGSVSTNSDNIIVIERHKCDPAWLFSHPFLLRYKSEAAKHLEVKAASLLNVAIGSFYGSRYLTFDSCILSRSVAEEIVRHHPPVFMTSNLHEWLRPMHWMLFPPEILLEQLIVQKFLELTRNRSYACFELRTQHDSSFFVVSIGPYKVSYRSAGPSV